MTAAATSAPAALSEKFEVRLEFRVEWPVLSEKLEASLEL